MGCDVEALHWRGRWFGEELMIEVYWVIVVVILVDVVEVVEAGNDFGVGSGDGGATVVVLVVVTEVVP